MARGRNVARSQVALAWLLQKSAITAPIIGASKPNHLTEAAAAVEVKLTADEVTALEAPYVPHPFVGYQ